MSWFTDANCEAESLKDHVCLAYAVDLDFPSAHVRVGSWSGDLIIGGNVFTGVGTLGSVSNVPERAQLTTERWVYMLSGVDPAVVPESEIDNCFGRSVIEYEVWINPATFAVIGTEINREGTMGRVRRRDGGEPCIEVSCETRLVILEQADGWRFTTEHQEKFFSGDLGLDFVRRMESITLNWGGHVVPEYIPGVSHPRFGPKR